MKKKRWRFLGYNSLFWCDKIMDFLGYILQLLGIYLIFQVANKQKVWWWILIAVVLYALGNRIITFYQRAHQAIHPHFKYWYDRRYNPLEDLLMRLRQN